MTTDATRAAYRELEERLRPFVARRVRAADVDDVVQDVFLRVQQSLSSLRDEQRFGAWLHQVARSAIAERHRQNGKQPELGIDESESSDVASGSEADGPSALEVELASYMLPFVSRLPSPYREALTLTELEGLTQQAAADALGISLSGMKSRVQRAREKLRELLEDCCRIGLDARGRVIECVPRDPRTCGCKNS